MTRKWVVTISKPQYVLKRVFLRLLQVWGTKLHGVDLTSFFSLLLCMLELFQKMFYIIVVYVVNREIFSVINHQLEEKTRFKFKFWPGKTNVRNISHCAYSCSLHSGYALWCIVSTSNSVSIRFRNFLLFLCCVTWDFHSPSLFIFILCLLILPSFSQKWYHGPPETTFGQEKNINVKLSLSALFCFFLSISQLLFPRKKY